MCHLNKKYDGEKFAGYKVVLLHEETGKMYSPATGVEYVAGEPVQEYDNKPIRLKTDNFDPWLNVPRSTSYEYNMVGRTCAFVNAQNAESLRRRLTCTDVSVVDGDCAELEGYTPRVVKAVLSKELIAGTYGIDAYNHGIEVVGGRFIESIELMSSSEIEKAMFI